MPAKPAERSPSSRIGTDIDGYYRLHARVYDATRWTFLFGRTAIVDMIARANASPARILEIGCGTGRNLASLARRFPAARITGLDLSEAMLAVARRKTIRLGDRVSLVRRSYDAPICEAGAFDVVLCSYALTMFNPGFERAIAAAARDLAPGGLFALVDFHATRMPWFERWMGMNHVRMDGQLRPLLCDAFEPIHDTLRSAYGLAWDYLLFLGRRRARSSPGTVPAPISLQPSAHPSTDVRPATGS